MPASDLRQAHRAAKLVTAALPPPHRGTRKLLQRAHLLGDDKMLAGSLWLSFTKVDPDLWQRVASPDQHTDHTLVCVRSCVLSLPSSSLYVLRPWAKQLRNTRRRTAGVRFEDTGMTIRYTDPHGNQRVSSAGLKRVLVSARKCVHACWLKPV